jgi:hypothetical protein
MYNRALYLLNTIQSLDVYSENIKNEYRAIYEEIAGGGGGI